MTQVTLQEPHFSMLKIIPFLEESSFRFKRDWSFIWKCSLLGKNLSNFASLNLKLHNRYCHSQQLGQFNSVESLQILGPCCWEIRKGNQKKLLMPGSRFHRIGFSFFIKKRICPRKRKLIYQHIISHL